MWTGEGGPKYHFSGKKWGEEIPFKLPNMQLASPVVSELPFTTEF